MALVASVRGGAFYTKIQKEYLVSSVTREYEEYRECQLYLCIYICITNCPFRVLGRVEPPAQRVYVREGPRLLRSWRPHYSQLQLLLASGRDPHLQSALGLGQLGLEPPILVE